MMATKPDPPDSTDYVFTDEPPDSLKCLICLQVSQKPQQHGKCGKLFCETCVAKYRKSSPQGSCPNCRDVFDTFNDGKSDMEVKSLKVKCNSYKCSWRGELLNFPKHKSVCPRLIVKCTKCSGKMRRENLKGHLANYCPNRSGKCPHCGEIKNKLPAHIAQCDYQETRCPTLKCTTKVIKKNLRKHLLVCEFVMMSCDNAKAGCKLKVARKDMPAHRLVCEFESLVCVKEKVGCKEKILRRNIQKHKLVCAYEMVNCERAKNGCKDQILRKNLSAHKSKCDYEPQACVNIKTGCKEKPMRKDLKQHQCVCPYEPLTCKYSEAGCTERPLRKDLKTHEENTQLHLEISYKEVVELRKQTATLSAKVNELEKRLGSLDPTPSYKFKVINYEDCKEKSLFSPPFYTSASGYKMCVRVDTGGEGSAKGTHVSVSVYLMKGEYDDSLTWPFTAVVTIELLNHLEDKNHHKWTGTFPDHDRVTDADKASVGYGRTQFIPHTELSHNADKGCQYLMNGTLAFRITVQLPSYKPWLEN